MPCLDGRNLKGTIINFKDRCSIKYSKIETVPLVNLFDKVVGGVRMSQNIIISKNLCLCKINWEIKINQ